ncbi:helix-turn-helix domain-containing protein [Terrilactibacillus sp. S3-3]|nr:helix-turn-helix domain-containing protein [Terrilactibacillus sp. S3-3]
MSDLSGEIGYTSQYIRKKFEKYIGFSPKQFCQVVKFQNSLDRILGASAGDFDFMDITLESGFYDQSHFIRGFKKFANFTPKQYMEYLH